MAEPSAVISAGASAQSERARGAASRLELLAAAHVGGGLVFSAWAYGGNSAWARTALAGWGSAAILLIMAALWPAADRRAHLRRIGLLWPLVLFDLFVGLSLLNPNYRMITDGVSEWFVRDPSLPRWALLPSTARPDLSLRSLWFFNAAYLSCFNLLLLVKHRHILRALLVVLAVNCSILAVFGTVQKLVRAPGLFFGATKSVQPHFFSSFIYPNHWGAFALLMIAAMLGLVFHLARRQRWRDFWHSPVLVALLGIVLAAATVPLSGSRSSTVLVLALLSGGAAFGLFRLLQARRDRHAPIARPVMLVLAGAVVAAGFVYQLAEPVIVRRLAQTRRQIAGIRAKGQYLPNQVLYRDTWRLARERMWLGWGMASYPTAFYSYNTQHYSPDGPNRLFRDAHSDWLQSVAEVGLVGSTLFVLCAAVPLASVWRRVPRGSAIPGFLLAGCGGVLVYALMEFPFGNGAVILAFWGCFFTAVRYRELDARLPSRG